VYRSCGRVLGVADQVFVRLRRARTANTVQLLHKGIIRSGRSCVMPAVMCRGFWSLSVCYCRPCITPLFLIFAVHLRLSIRFFLFFFFFFLFGCGLPFFSPFFRLNWFSVSASDSLMFRFYITPKALGAGANSPGLFSYCFAKKTLTKQDTRRRTKTSKKTTGGGGGPSGPSLCQSIHVCLSKISAITRKT